MHRERLEALRDLLRDPDRLAALVQRFDMGLFVDFEDDCGTAACALGTACLYPPFRALGLTVDARGYPEYRPPAGGVVYGVAAGRDFFGLSAGDADRLFYVSSYYRAGVTPADVADRIDAILALPDPPPEAAA